MNRLHLSQTDAYDGERQWISVLHTGIDDKSISMLTDDLPPKDWTCSEIPEITKLMVHLSVKTNEREVILKKVAYPIH